MKRITSKLLIVAFVLSMSSCAVLFNGSSKRISITSNTPEGKIYVDGNLVGTGTASVKLKRKEDHTIIVKKDGCKSQTIPLDKEFQIGWVALYLFVNPFAIITDAPTGAWFGFNKSQVIVPELECNK
ncbi:MAG: PEGA domain-containing protein [Paludibacter sp.]